MFNKEITNQLLDVFCDVSKPFSGSIAEWAKQNIKLPETFGQPGRCDLSTSPWLLAPLDDFLDPKVKMIIKIMAVRIGKSMTDQITIPYIISQSPGTVLRIHQDDDAASNDVDTKLLPILRSTEAVAPLIPIKKGVKNGIINLPNMYIRYSGDKESIAHSVGIRFLFLDEAHMYEFGLIKKFIARTLDFAGRSKIVISSTPNEAGSELHKYYNSGNIYEWQFKCQNPECGKYQQYAWSKQRNDLSYGGFNWDSILTADGEYTNVALSAKTCWLECFFCKHKHFDNLQTRRKLNDEGKYICIKSDGDSSIKAYTCPLFVNLNLSFEFFAAEYLNAKKLEKQTGLSDDIITFVTGKLGRFYKADPMADAGKIMRGDYIPNPTEYDTQWVNLMGVDYQAAGKIKYYVIRAFNKNGNESRRLAFGVCRTWDELDEIRQKWNVRIPCCGIDSGNDTDTVYQECLKHGQAYKTTDNHVGYDCWIPMKGDGAKLSYNHLNDKVSRYYSQISKQDPKFPIGSKYKGLFAPLILWSNYSIKTILMNLRDNKIPGVKWLVDARDPEYEKQMASEGLQHVLDKKTGMTTLRWKLIGEHNEYLDCEAMILVLAIRANVFSATKVDEEEVLKIIDDNKDKINGKT